MHMETISADEELDEEDLDLIQENLGIRLPKVIILFLSLLAFIITHILQ